MATRPPDRLGAMIARIEAGEMPTSEEFQRLYLLQALDLVKYGNDFVQEALVRETEMIEVLRGASGG